jgi:preprotein translocase subunit SecF
MSAACLRYVPRVPPPRVQHHPAAPRWFVLSGSAILVSIIALVVLGLNYSIDFTGGTLIDTASRTT